MRDGVADVLAQRAAIDRGAGVGIAFSVLLHGALIVLAIYTATHASAPQAAQMVSIEFAKLPGPTAAPAMRQKPAAKPIEPKIEEPKPKVEPKITEPKPAAVTTPAKVEKNTVPLSPFGRSTKQGSENPPVAKPAVPPPAAPTGATTAEIPIGGSGVTGLEGGDFPYTLYIQGMHRRIGNNWFRPEVPAGTATVIYFRIQRDGTISEARVETSSGNGTFDRAALSAVRSSSPLNPLPFAYNGTYLGVHQTFR
jgi:TonB family protein